MTDLATQIGQTIKTIRTHRGYSMKQLSKKAHVSIAYISEIENAKTNASYDVIEALTHALDITTPQLLRHIAKNLEQTL